MQNIFGCNHHEFLLKDNDYEEIIDKSKRESYNYVSYICDLKHRMMIDGYIPKEERTQKEIKLL